MSGVREANLYGYEKLRRSKKHGGNAATRQRKTRIACPLPANSSLVAPPVTAVLIDMESVDYLDLEGSDMLGEIAKDMRGVGVETPGSRRPLTPWSCGRPANHLPTRRFRTRDEIAYERAMFR